MRAPTGDPLDFDCPRCSAPASEAFYGPCSTCRDDLAARLGITSSTATGLVDRLVELELLTRHEEPADRRQVVVAPTAKAETTVEHFRELNSRRMREMLERVAAADLAVIERALHILDAVLPEPGTATHPTVTATEEGKHS